MGGVPRPVDGFLEQQEYYGTRGVDKIWRSVDGERYYTWDSLHGEVEVFNKRGKHLGSLDAMTGALIKDPVKGRRIEL